MAKQSSSTVSFASLAADIKARKFANVYLLMGDESYYIDKITDLIASSVLPEEERTFNQVTIYCTGGTACSDIIDNARRYPMMSEYQVVIVKEAQNLQKIDELLTYVQNPLSSTVLVICHKNGCVDKRKKIVASIGKVGVIFESMKLSESSLPGFITSYLKERNVTIDAKSVGVMAESVGADLNRMAGELDKLIVSLPSDSKVITPEQIERCIGISKEYNMWELKTAVVNKDVFKANQILTYFASNPKSYSPIPVVSMLFGFFAQVMQAYYAPDRSLNGVVQHLGIYQRSAMDIITGMRNYSGMKTMQIIDRLRRADAQLKGLDRGANVTDEDVMKELMYFILH